MNKKLDEIIKYIIESNEYKKCIELKEQMNKNNELNSLISNIKKLQKKYVNTNDENVLKELTRLESALNEIPIYVIYTQYLERVNEKLNFISEELNDYFYKAVNN